MLRILQHSLAATLLIAGGVLSLAASAAAQQTYLKASDSDFGDRFGSAVSISGDTLVVGAPFEESAASGVNGDDSDNTAREPGAAYVFVRTGSTWSQQAYLKPSNTHLGPHLPGDMFGASVSIAGDTIVVGAPLEDSSAVGVNGSGANNDSANSGAAYVFVRSGTVWSQQAYLKASNTEFPPLGDGDRFGTAVTVSADTIVVGAVLEPSNATGLNGDQINTDAPSAGAAYVFVRTGTSWTQQAYLKPSNTRAFFRFGCSVSLSNDTLAVGARRENTDSMGVDANQSGAQSPGVGAVYMFVRSGTNWSQQTYIKASNAGFMDEFGTSVSVSGDLLVVGAPRERSGDIGVDGNQSDDSLGPAGAAYLFERSGTDWSQVAYLKASNTDLSDFFGSTVSNSGNFVVVGARDEKSAALGVNGDQSDNSSNSAGAAYVFSRIGTTWCQLYYLKAPNSEEGDQYGVAVSVSADTVVIGASGEDSNAVGVNGVQSDNSKLSSGAAYVFKPSPQPPLALPISFCFGDGLGRQCKCGNNDALNPGTGGCLHSSGMGTVLSPNTDIQVCGNSLSFDVTSGVPGAFAVLASGDNALGGGLGILGMPESDGLRCVGGNFLRHGSRMLDAAGATTIAWGAPGSNPPGGIIHRAGFFVGQTRYFQVRTRDLLTGPCGFGTNTSQAIEITFAP